MTITGEYCLVVYPHPSIPRAPAERIERLIGLDPKADGKTLLRLLKSV